MTTHMRLIISAAAAFLLAPSLLPAGTPFGAATTVFAQGWYDPYRSVHHHRRARHSKPDASDDAKSAASAPGEKKTASPSAASSDQQPPPRVPFTAAEDAAATIPGMPDARFWADS